MNSKVSCAIAAILSGNVAGYAYAAPDSEGSGGDELKEVTVTAQRRAESAQDVPIQIQVLTAETLTQLNVTTFDDFAKYLPNVTVSSNGPSWGDIYMRGLATTTGGTAGSGATGSFPNVAVYLDDLSVQLPERNLDIYAVDMERIEVLEGPPGTLFGAGAEAGVIRYITNKPKLNVTEGNANAGYATTTHGDRSSSLDAVINLPLLDDKLAVRAVIYNDSRGGYIDNIPGTFTRSGNDVGIAYLFGGTTVGSRVIAPGVVPPGSMSINNNSLVDDAINPLTYKGTRLSGLYQINDNWSALVTQSYQDMQADGVFTQTVLTSDAHPLPELSAQLYNPSFDHDRFTNSALTIDGRIGQLRAVYSGGYLVRTVDQVLDYTNYARGKYADYYQCILPGSPFAYSAPAEAPLPTTDSPGTCFSPSSTWRVHEKNTHQSHEFRLSTPDDARLRAIGGLFWEDYKIYENADWLYKAAEAGFSPIVPPTGSVAINPTVRDENVAFFDDITRGYKQKAAFASVDFDLIPKTLTLTAATRYYRINDFEVGSKVGSYGCRQGGIYSGYGAADGTIGAVPNPCLDGYSAKDLGLQNLQRTYSGFRSRGNLSWKITPDVLLYGTWSQGFRPGGYNRGSNNISSSSPVYGIFTVPVAYAPDTLTNKELGWKTQWLDHRLQFNGAFYQEDWKNVQISLFDPGVFGNLVFTTNGPDYRVRGVETELVARVTPALTVSGSAAWNDSKLVNEPTLIDNTGQPLAINPYGAHGSPLAQAPRFQANLRVRYEFALETYTPFVQVSGTHRTRSFATTDRFSTDLQGNSIAYVQPGFSTVDAAAGVSRDAWSLQLYGQNLTDVRGNLFTGSSQYTKTMLINRPRTIGLRFSYEFAGK
jgi:outer membrane receptor protein involved in Fe transport